MHDTKGASTVFQLRAEVKPGDQEYILVTTGNNALTGVAGSGDVPTLAVQFHGAIATTSVKRNRRLTRGNPDPFEIKITAPGLLTLETTGSTDTVGTLDAPDDENDTTNEERAYAESGGSGGNFKMVVPVITDANNYSVTVEGQTLDTAGAYTVGMAFNVAMTTPDLVDSDNTKVIDGVAGPTWTNTAVTADDTTVQIKKIAEANTADADYFLFTPTTSGFLTVNANDDATKAKDSNTTGTLYGAMGEGPIGEMRVGQIATDADSGPDSHFPVHRTG